MIQEREKGKLKKKEELLDGVLQGDGAWYTNAGLAVARSTARSRE
jgi:hypothetical protein